MSEEQQSNVDPRIEQLLTEFSSNRESIKSKLDELIALGADVTKMFPKSGDFRSKFALDDKIKASTAFYATILSFSTELSRSIKDEIDIRRRLLIMDKSDMDQDIRKIINEMRKKGFDATADELRPVGGEKKDADILVFDNEQEDDNEVENG